LGAASLACAIPVDDAAFGEIVGRDLEIDAIARENLDAMAAQAARDVREDRLTRLEFYRERRARKDLFDRSEEFERRLFRRFFSRPQGGGPRRGSASYDFT
jgi:hypothetical protein